MDKKTMYLVRFNQPQGVKAVLCERVELGAEKTAVDSAGELNFTALHGPLLPNVVAPFGLEDDEASVPKMLIPTALILEVTTVEMTKEPQLPQMPSAPAGKSAGH